MKKQFLVIDLNDASYYIVDDLNLLIAEMYEVELGNGEDIDTVIGQWFLENYKVFEIEGTISEFN
jgi:hypothetical protein